MEIWKDIVGYEGLYEVSNIGRVKTKVCKNSKGDGSYENIMAPITNPNFYLSVKLCNGISIKKFSIHRLVAIAFLYNPENKPQVDHIDHDRQNNNVGNLRWVTNIENQRHSAHKRRGLQNKTSRIVVHVEYGSFYNLKEASELSGYCRAHMAKMLDGKIKNKTKFIDA